MLVDGVKVISRLLLQAKEISVVNSIFLNSSLFRNRYRTARRISRQIDGLSKTRNQSGRQKREQAYSKLIEVTRSCLKQAQKVKNILMNSNPADSQKILQKLTVFLPRIEQVIQQAYRRVLNKEKVPADEKIVSIFEAHTDIICRGKINLDVEFGHKIWLDEVDGGIVSNYRILKGNPHDTQQLIPSIERQARKFWLCTENCDYRQRCLFSNK